MDLMAPSEVSKQCRNSVEVRFTELICAKNPTGTLSRQVGSFVVLQVGWVFMQRLADKDGLERKSPL